MVSSGPASKKRLGRIPLRRRLFGWLVILVAIIQLSELLSNRQSFLGIGLQGRVYRAAEPPAQTFDASFSTFARGVFTALTGERSRIARPTARPENGTAVPQPLETLPPPPPPARRIAVMGLYNSGSSALAEVRLRRANDGAMCPPAGGSRRGVPPGPAGGPS